MENLKPKMSIKKGTFFFVVLIGVFVLTFSVLYFIGLVPNYFKPETAQDIAGDFYDLPENDQVLPDTFTRPDRVIIEKVGIDAKISKPSTVNVNVLDDLLRQGAVYYPGSGTIEQGNIFLFGHSTNWAVVQNQAYKTFNGLEKLKKGDEIVLESGGENFIYKVTDVELVDADNALVEFNNSGQTLTISTCNTFGEKQERWVVQAVLTKN